MGVLQKSMEIFEDEYAPLRGLLDTMEGLDGSDSLGSVKGRRLEAARTRPLDHLSAQISCRVANETLGPLFLVSEEPDERVSRTNEQTELLPNVVH
jgi:hypothetical protein